MLPRNAKCPTALHSWGSQVLPCPCGCRPTGFSASTLGARGIYGVFIPQDGTTDIDGVAHQQFRHVHPSELAVLTGTPIPRDWPPLRLALCGLGQQASPLQAVWIAGQVHRMIDAFFGDLVLFDYLRAFRTLIAIVDRQSKALFADTSDSEIEPPVASSLSPECPLAPLDSLPPWVVRVHHGAELAFTINFEATKQHEVIAVSHGLVTIGNLRAAEVHINPLVELWDFIDCETGLALSNDCLVVGKAILHCIP